jgi:hypothetical protein
LTIFVVVAVTKVTASCGTGRPQVCNDPVSCADCLAGQFEETKEGANRFVPLAHREVTRTRPIY